MTYLDLIREADWKLVGGKITLEEFENMIEPLRRDITEDKPQGEWIKTPKAVMGEGYMWYCNKCRHEVYQDTSRDYPTEKYCPNCGAKMGKER